MNDRRIVNAAEILIQALKSGHANGPVDLMNLFNDIWPEPAIEEGVNDFLTWCNVRTALCTSVALAYRAGQKDPA